MGKKFCGCCQTAASVRNTGFMKDREYYSTEIHQCSAESQHIARVSERFVTYIHPRVFSKSVVFPAHDNTYFQMYPLFGLSILSKGVDCWLKKRLKRGRNTLKMMCIKWGHLCLHQQPWGDTRLKQQNTKK